MPSFATSQPATIQYVATGPDLNRLYTMVPHRARHLPCIIVAWRQARMLESWKRPICNNQKSVKAHTWPTVFPSSCAHVIALVDGSARSSSDGSLHRPFSPRPGAAAPAGSRFRIRTASGFFSHVVHAGKKQDSVRVSMGKLPLPTYNEYGQKLQYRLINQFQRLGFFWMRYLGCTSDPRAEYSERRDNLYQAAE